MVPGIQTTRGTVVRSWCGVNPGGEADSWQEAEELARTGARYKGKLGSMDGIPGESQGFGEFGTVAMAGEP